jgi:hypothetical protein
MGVLVFQKHSANHYAAVFDQQALQLVPNFFNLIPPTTLENLLFLLSSVQFGDCYFIPTGYDNICGACIKRSSSDLSAAPFSSGH